MGVEQHSKSVRRRYDVPLSMALGYRDGAALVVSGVNGASHHDHLLELAKRVRVELVQGIDVAQGRQGDQRDFSRAFSHLIAQVLDCIRCRFRVCGALIPFLLGKSCGVARGRPLCHYDVATTQARQKPADEKHSRASVAPGRGDSEYLEARVLKRYREREGIIDIITDVR